MTIAIHLSGGGSQITATDTQHTYTTGEKVDSGKIISLWRPNPIGGITIAGAGEVLYMNALAQEIKQGFDDFKGTFVELKSKIERITQAFYTTHVLPHEGKLDKDDLPDFALLVAVRHQGEGALWNVEKTLVTEASLFDCIGIGSAMAEALLGRLWPEYPSLDTLAVLAAYTIWRVKASVDGCGLETEIRFIHRDRPGMVSMELIEKWEALFRKYERLERDLFYHAMGYQIELAIPKQIAVRMP